MRLFVSDPPRWLGWLLFGFCVVLMLVRDLPWHLDDKDQAKQAFIAVEMLHDGGLAWWFQHTPAGEIATKPPLMGWLNAGLRSLGIPWDWAWRLPGLLASAWLLWALWQRGRASGLGWIALVPPLVFGANLLTPRLAALVRTDALLAAAVAWAVLAVWDQLRWQSTQSEQAGDMPAHRDASWPVTAALALAAMLKGPIAWVFLLPGAIAYGIWRLIERRRRSGELGKSNLSPLPVRWWAWVLPLLPFLVWSLAAMKFQPGFYDQVVVREFFGRFESGEDATHNVLPVYDYVLQLAKAFAPWVIGAVVLTVFDRRCWQRVLRDPASRWLFLAAVGGLLVMSLIPSKRLDRVYPIVPPLALFAGALVSSCRDRRALPLTAITAGVAVLAYGGYSVAMAVERTRNGEGAFTRSVRDQLPALLARRAVDLDQGMVGCFEDGRKPSRRPGGSKPEKAPEALFVWQPDIRLLRFEELEGAITADELEVVLIHANDHRILRALAPEMDKLGELPPAAESESGLEVWLLR